MRRDTVFRHRSKKILRYPTKIFEQVFARQEPILQDVHIIYLVFLGKIQKKVKKSNIFLQNILENKIFAVYLQCQKETN